MDSVSIGPLDHRWSCNSVIRLHGATEVNITISSFQVETQKDVLWFYPGLRSRSDDLDTYPGFDDGNPPPMFATSSEPNFWFEIFTDKNIVSQGITFSISAGKCKTLTCFNC